jgi:hypothetical protein
LVPSQRGHSFPFLEVYVIDIVIQIINRIESIEQAQGHCSHFVGNIAVGVSINNRDHVTLGMIVRHVVSKFGIRKIACIDNAWIRQLYICRRLKVNILSKRLKELV